MRSASRTVNRCGTSVRGPMSGRVVVFDTTLRDGEQSPGCSMTPAEKVRLAGKLERLGVDVIEAGFPSASPGEFGSVEMVAAEVHTARVAALARSKTEGVSEPVCRRPASRARH